MNRTGVMGNLRRDPIPGCITKEGSEDSEILFNMIICLAKRCVLLL